MPKGAKFGGRTKGTPNVVTRFQRERISDWLQGEWEGFTKDYKALKAPQRVVIYEKLMQYAIPRLQSTTLTDTEGNNVNLNSTCTIIHKSFTDESGNNDNL